MSASPPLDQQPATPDGFGPSSGFSTEPRSSTPVNAYLRSLPPLQKRTTGKGSNVCCKMCGGQTSLFTCVDFNKSCHPDILYGDSGVLIDYWRCHECEFLFTPFCDSWTNRDFAELIYNDDYTKVDGEFLGARARRTAEGLAPLFDGAQNQRILDYGSGSGEFTNALGQMGFANAVNYDPYTHPLRPTGRFAIVTAFDVIEHSADPPATLRDMLDSMADDGCLLIGQTLQPRDIEQIRGDWWYLAPRNGHISLFSEETIRGFAESHALDFHNFGAMFALSRPQRSALVSEIIARNHPVERRDILYAPGLIDGEPFGWHPLEREAPYFFRWTAHHEADLGTISLEGERELAIPVHIAMAPRFLDEARLKIGDVLLPLKLRRKKWLVANFMVGRKTRYAVSLLTPPPIKPTDGDDNRTMGIAVFSHPAPTPD